MSLNHDQHYIDATINGNSRAFAVLVDRYKHMVFTIAKKVLKIDEEAEEVAQDVFIKVYQSMHTFKGESKFSTWLYRIAYHKSLDYLKKQKRSLTTSSIDSNMEYHLESVGNILDNFEAEDRKATIKSAMDQLAHDDSVVLTLHYFEELSLKEIAKIIGLETNTVKVRLFRSRKRLAEILQHKLEPEIIRSYGKK